MTDREARTVEFRDAELNGMDFRGYAAVFDTPWEQQQTDQAGYVEIVARGAFRKALRTSGDIPLLWQHDRNQLLATSKSGNLMLAEDPRGLVVEARLPHNTLGEYVREMIQRGDVQGMSYGRQTRPEDSIITRKNGVYERRVSLVRRLLDVTLTWEPAFAATSVELRAASFVALPLQEFLKGQEGQLEDAADNPPDGAGWGEPPTETKQPVATAVERRLARRRFLDEQLAWEVDQHANRDLPAAL